MSELYMLIKVRCKQLPLYSGRMKPLVAGSIGPYGACLNDGSEYHGNYVSTVDMKVILEY